MIKKNFWPIFYNVVFFFLAVIVTIRNLGLTKYFIGEDSGLSLTFADRLFESVYYMWDSLTAPGKMNITSTFGFLWSNFVLLFFNLGLNDIHIKRIMYALFFFVSGGGMFFLLNILLRIYAAKIQKNIAYFASFVGGLLYMLNPFTIHMTNLPIIPYHSSYMMLPLVLGLFIYNLQIHSSLISTVVFSWCAFFLISANPSNTVSIGAFFLFYMMFFWKEIASANTPVKKFIIISVFLLLLLTSYIYLPAIFSQANPYGDLGSFTNYLLSLNLQSSFTSFINLLRLTGGVIWAFFPFYEQYTQNPVLIFISFVLPFLVFISFLFTGQKKIKTFFGIVIVVSLFFAKGSHPPFENIFLFLYKTIPFFGMFRAVYYKFAFFAVLSYAVLLSFTTIYLYQYLKHRFRKLLIFIFIIPFIILMYGWPFFVGGIPKHDYLTRIPNDYIELRGILRSDRSDSKVLALPPAPRGAGLLLQWEDNNKYAGPHPDTFLINRPVYDSYWFIRAGYKDLNVEDSWIGKRFEESFAETLQYMGILNIRYLLVHHDFVENYDFGGVDIRKIDGKLKAEKLVSIISEYPEIKLIKKTSYYSLYKLPDSLFLPHFYIPDSFIYSDNQFKTLFDDTNTDRKKAGYAILPMNQVKNAFRSDKEHTPTVSFTQINPAKYNLKIKQAKKLFYLVFSETFDSNWKLYINSTAIEDTNHIKVNGYANAWRIDVNQLCSDKKNDHACLKNKDGSYDFELIIEFFPQRLFYIGLSVSLITFIGCLAFIVFRILKKKVV